MNLNLYENDIYDDITDMLDELIEDDDIIYLMNLLILINPLIEAAKEVDINYLESLDFSNKSTFQIEDAIKLVTLFLKEKYPSKTQPFENLCREKNKIIFISKEEQLALNTYCIEFLQSLLAKYSIEDTKQIIKDNLQKSNIRPLSISLEYLLDIFEEFEQTYNQNSEESSKKDALIKLVTNPQIFHKLFQGPENIYQEDGTILILDTKDINTVTGLLHEFIHEDNIVNFINKDQTNQESNNEEEFNYTYDYAKYLTELPSITIEGEFLDWLLQNNYITEIDYNFKKAYRIKDTYEDIYSLISLKKLLEIRINQGFITKEEIIKNLECNPEDIFTIGDYEEINNFITYFIAFFIGTAYNELQAEEPETYDKKLMAFHQLLSFKNFEDLLKILNIDLTDEQSTQKLIDNFIKHNSNYLKTGRNPKRS